VEESDEVEGEGEVLYQILGIVSFADPVGGSEHGVEEESDRVLEQVPAGRMDLQDEAVD
jgi:hypothetical protein